MRRIVEIKYWLPRTSGVELPIMWVIAPDEIYAPKIKLTFARLLHRAVGFHQRIKWGLLRAFLDSDKTVKDMQHALGLRRPGLVADLFFKYKITEAREGAFMDALEDALDVDLNIRFEKIERN